MGREHEVKAGLDGTGMQSESATRFVELDLVWCLFAADTIA